MLSAAASLVRVHANSADQASSIILLAGKSMGSRAACQLAINVCSKQAAAHIEGIRLAGTVAFGYPMVGGKGTIRDELVI